jgi:hypothetical protein
MNEYVRNFRIDNLVEEIPIYRKEMETPCRWKGLRYEAEDSTKS